MKSRLMRLKSASRKCGAEENCVRSDLLEPLFWLGTELPTKLLSARYAFSRVETVNLEQFIVALRITRHETPPP
jgi:hypothetical protein